jgi:hypothetical protein
MAEPAAIHGLVALDLREARPYAQGLCVVFDALR